MGSLWSQILEQLDYFQMLLKVAELAHAMLYLNELNKLEKKEANKKPIQFYLSTYGGK